MGEALVKIFAGGAGATAAQQAGAQGALAQGGAMQALNTGSQALGMGSHPAFLQQQGVAAGGNPMTGSTGSFMDRMKVYGKNMMELGGEQWEAWKEGGDPSKRFDPSMMPGPMGVPTGGMGGGGIANPYGPEYAQMVQAIAAGQGGGGNGGGGASQRGPKMSLGQLLAALSRRE